MTVSQVKAHVVDDINAYQGMEVEYYEIVNGYDMQPISDWSDTDYPVGCVTVNVGNVRLIDNIKYSAAK